MMIYNLICFAEVHLLPRAQLDTMKTRVQSSASASIGTVLRSLPDIGLRGLYR